MARVILVVFTSKKMTLFSTLFDVKATKTTIGTCYFCCFYVKKSQTPNFFPPAAGCLGSKYVAIWTIKKSAKFFSACGGLSRKWPFELSKKPQIFFRLRRAVSKVSMWPFEPSKKAPNFFPPAAGCLRSEYVAIWTLKKSPKFFSACGGCLGSKYVAIWTLKKTPNFFPPAAGCLGSEYVTIWTLKKKPKFAHPARKILGTFSWVENRTPPRKILGTFTKFEKWRHYMGARTSVAPKKKKTII